MKTYSTMGEILERTQARYLRVEPSGLSFPDGRILQRVKAILRRHHPARTLYQNRRPVCRSLNGRNPLKKADKNCAACVERSVCTPQMLLTILVQLEPFYLLLAHTSLKNFMSFRENLSSHAENEPIELLVQDRRTWGEIVFLPVERNPTLFD